MSARRVVLVAGRHARDLIRDRRTLFALLMFPILTVVMLSITRSEIVSGLAGQAALDHDVVVQGGDVAPDLMARLRRGPFSVSETPDLRVVLRSRSGAVGLLIPADFARAIRSGERAAVEVVTGDTSLRTELARSALVGLLDDYGETIVKRRLRAAGLPPSQAVPLSIAESSVASREEQSGSLLGQFLPFMVIAQVITLMSSIAVDLTAGEKERRTIEALVATPLTRREIVVGKWIVTVVLGLLGATTTIVAAVVTFRSATGDLLGGLTLPSGALPALAVGAGALAVVVSAMQLIIGFFARSTQQAGIMIAPLFFLTFIPVALFEGQSGHTLPHALYAIPLLGPSLLAKFGLSGTAPTSATMVVLVSSALYAATMLALADRVFRSERALLRI